LRQLIKYSGVFVKSKAIKAKQLTQEDFDQLMQKTSLSEIVMFLKNETHYGEIFKEVPERNLHRGDIENPLKKYYFSIIKKYYIFIASNDRKFFKMIFLKEEIEAVKTILRRIDVDKERFIAPIDDYVAAHFSIDIKKLSQMKSMDEFMDNISGAGFEKTLKYAFNTDSDKNMFFLEMALDSYYYKQLMDELSKNKESIIKNIYGIEIDMKNIIWIYRCKKYYNVPKEIIYSYHIPYNYKLEKKKLKEMMDSKNLEELFGFIEKSPYKDLIKGLEDESGKKIFIENNYDKYFSNVLKKINRAKPFSIISVIEELYSVNAEINKIINIVECIRYSLNEKEIKNLVG